TLALIEAADTTALAALALVRDAGGHRKAGRAQYVGDRLLLGRRGRGDVLVELAGLGLGHVLVGEALHHHLLRPPARPGDGQAVAGADLAVRLGRALAVDLDLAALAGPLGLRARLEQAGDVEPDVQAGPHGPIRTDLI